MLFKLTRLSSIFLKSCPKNYNLTSKVLLTQCKSLSSTFSSPNNLTSTLNFNRFYSSTGGIAKEMEAFLTEEIKAEKANSKPVSSVPGFEVKADGAMVELTRKFKDESIRIRLNVNGSTTDDEMPEAPDAESMAGGPILSKPTFSIEIIKPSGKTLCLSCNFANDMPFEGEDQSVQGQEQPSEDIFEIDGITVLDKPENEIDETVYMGDASLIDGQLYDILMDYLDERGIGKEFASHLIDYCTAYEHERYIKLLEDLKNFVK